MNKSAIESFFGTFYDDAGKIRLPTSEQERQRFANGAIGFVATRAFEGAFDSAREKLRNRQPKQPAGRPSSDAAFKDAALRDILSTLSESQKLAVLQLVRDELYLLTFSLFGALDQFDFGLIGIGIAFKRSLSEDDDIDGEDDDLDDRPPDVTILPHQAELHSQWVSWSGQFSSVRKVEGPALWDADAAAAE